jgi:diguanylate cyclase (GGDEF)-like protein
MKQVGKVKELEALFLLLPFLPYVLFAIGCIMGCRFNNAEMILTTAVLCLSYFALTNLSPVSSAKGVVGPSIPEAMSFLLPLNLAYFATLRKRRIYTSTGLFCVGLVMFQVLVVIILCNPQMSIKIEGSYPFLSKPLADVSMKIRSFLHRDSLYGLKHISSISALSLLGGIIFLSTRFYKSRDSLSAGSLCTLISTFLGVAVHSNPSPMLYFSAAGLILIITSIESSFSMAYLDELTGLPGRRSLNETLMNLGKGYAIAMIDIDHFKKFNDKYGHKTGDQVLNMVASKLKELTGGAKVFRYGGEEFTAIFPGKTAQEAVPHLDTYRKIIETTPFIARGKGRRKSSVENRGKVKRASLGGIKITVSIGAASPNKKLTSPEKVLKAADKILYKAKKAGRNRVKS